MLCLPIAEKGNKQKIRNYFHGSGARCAIHAANPREGLDTTKGSEGSEKSLSTVADIFVGDVLSLGRKHGAGTAASYANRTKPQPVEESLRHWSGMDDRGDRAAGHYADSFR